MKPISQLLAAATAVLACTGVQASEALAQKYACVACHQADRKVVGPSWNDITAKYAADAKSPQSITRLADSIRKGGSGKWGNVPMPPQAALSDADAKALAHWLLTRSTGK